MNEIYERILKSVDVEFINEHPEITLDLINYLLEERSKYIALKTDGK